VIESEFFYGQLPGLLGGQLVNGQLKVIPEIIGGKEFFIRLIIDNGEAAAFQLINSIDKAPQLDALDIYEEASFQGYRQVKIGAVNLPEFGQNLFTEFLILLFFLRRFVPLGQPALRVMRQQVFQGRWRGCIYPEKELDATMQGRPEAEIPFIFGF
jgi:hypothetical protein